MSGSDWLTGREARALLLSVGPAHTRLGATLFRYAADGLLRTRAKSVIINETRRSEDVNLPASLWAQLLGGAPLIEDWLTSCFDGSRYPRRSDDVETVRLVGVQFNLTDLRSALGLVAALVTEEVPGAPRAKRGYKKSDMPLVEEMHRLFESGEEPSLLQAATKLALSAQGTSTPESKRDRLYKQRRRGT